MESNGNFKGITYSVIVTVALVGILGALIGMSYQSSIGSRVGGSIVEKASQDVSDQKLENTKATIAGALKFGTMLSALDVAAQGGTADSLTYWECNGEPQPPELNEVLFALSNTSIQYFNSYLKTLKKDLKEKFINVSECDCVAIKPPKKEICMNEDCSSFGSGAKDEKIKVTFPTNTSYDGDIEVDISPIRFWMFYYRLYDFFKNNKLLQVIQKSMLANCPEDALVKYEIAYQDVCRDLIKELSRHDSPGGVECKTIKSEYEGDDHTEILCTHKYIDCRIVETGAPHTDCERDPREDICFSKKDYMQGNNKGILIELKDKKYKPLGEKPMIFNIHAVFIGLNIPECKPINQPINS